MEPNTRVFKRILVAVDRSEASRQAVELGARLAGLTGARVALLHVIDMSRELDPELGFADGVAGGELRSLAHDLLDRSRRMFPSGIRVDELIRDGDPPAEIVEAADKWGADLIIVGTYDHAPLARLLLRSTAESVVREAHCPVLIVGQAPTIAPAKANKPWARELAHVA
jgi:nucleotide-binding universal stress UspA family protein